MLNFQRPAVLYLIKHSLGSFLKGDIDASQVDSRIGAGFLELRDLQLNCDYISAFLVSPSVLPNPCSIREDACILQLSM